MKFIKWFVGAIVTLVVLVILAIIVLPKVIDPNDYRDEISALVKDNIGRDLNLDGNLELSVFPWLGIKTAGLRLSQPEGIEGDMLSVNEAQLRLKFAPLLSRRVEIDTIILTKPIVNLITLKSGLDSFSGLAGDDSEQVTTAAEKTSPPTTNSPVSLAIQGIEITQGMVVIDDRQAGSKMELSDLSLLTGDLLGGSLANIKATGQFKDASVPDVTRFDLDAQANIDIDSLELKLANMLATIVQGQTNLALTLDSLTSKDSSIIDAKNVGLKLSGIANVSAKIPSISANVESQTATIPVLTATVENMTAQLKNINVSSFIDDPKVLAELLIEKFNAAKLLQKLDIDYKPVDDKAMTSLGLAAKLSGGMNQASVSNLQVNLDETSLTGSAVIRNFDNPKIAFDLILDEINLDRYLPESAEEEVAEQNGSDALSVPMDMFSGVNANGSFKANTLTSGGVSLTDIDVLVKSTPGNVSITPKAKLYDGAIDGVIAFNKAGDTSTLKVKNEIGVVQLGQLLSDASVTERFNGIGKLSVDLLVTEVNGKQLNSGVISLAANDGQIEGININNIIDQASSAYSALKKLDGKEPQTASEIQNQPSDLTDFADLSGTFNLKNFLVTNNDLKVTAPGFNITGQGVMNLEQNTLDYTINLAISDKLSNSLAGKSLPVRCRGALDAPSCLPDMKALYKLLLKSKVDQKKAELKDRLLGIDNTDDSPEATENSAPKTKKEQKEELKKKLLRSIFD